MTMTTDALRLLRVGWHALFDDATGELVSPAVLTGRKDGWTLNRVDQFFETFNDPAVIEAIRRLIEDHGGKITADDLVEAARAPDHPAHDLLWNFPLAERNI